VLSLLRAEQARLARARRVARGETELRILNPAGAGLSLLRAGDTLEQARALDLPAGQVWLPEGRYFAEASAGGWRQFFPVTADGTGRGPEPDGTWTLTVRPLPREAPPQWSEHAPGFVFIPGGSFMLGERTNPDSLIRCGFRPSSWVSSR